jgi:hypothetical protein
VPIPFGTVAQNVANRSVVARSSLKTAATTMTTITMSTTKMMTMYNLASSFGG